MSKRNERIGAQDDEGVIRRNNDDRSSLYPEVTGDKSRATERSSAYRREIPSRDLRFSHTNTECAMRNLEGVKSTVGRAEIGVNERREAGIDR